jgi:flavin reductase (DIM6/NTAB) family NADH-FMN oxidoreductase RutF
MIASAVGATSLLHATSADFVRVKEAHFARLLYTNPVCLLTSSAANLRSASASLPATGALRNVMTVSWLAPTSNRGEFVMTLHAARYTARLVHAEGHRFVLSVPVRGMEALVKSIGACSGSGAVEAATEAAAEGESAGKAATSTSSSETDGSAAAAAVSAPAAAESSASAAAAPIVRADKIRQLAVPMCRPGCKSMQIAVHDDDEDDDEVDAEARADDADDAAAELAAVRGCCAHLVCTVTRALPATDANPASVAHNVLFCRVQRAYVHGAYFQNTQFVAPRGAPPYLSFLGSGGFAHVIAAPPQVASTRGAAD